MMSTASSKPIFPPRRLSMRSRTSSSGESYGHLPSGCAWPSAKWRLIRRHFADGHAHPDGRCPYDSPLDEVLDRIDRRRGGKIGFEEAVDIIESERNNAEPPDASLTLQSAGASRRGP